MQVCYVLDADNLDRELKGLIAALEFFKISAGTLVTYAQSDEFVLNGKTIKEVPAHEYLLQ